VITKAAEQARADGNDLVFLLAEEDDWPKELYAKLGFDVVGRVTWFVHRRDALLECALRELLVETGASRVTLRQDIQDDFFPVTHEALALGVKSIRDGAGIDLRGQPVVRELEETGAQVVQDDCATAFDEPDFHRMREAYGGLASQIVTPVLDEGRLLAIVSLHQCGEPRTWTDGEIALAAATADRVKEILRA
jgi:GAF domain-containing protein